MSQDQTASSLLEEFKQKIFVDSIATSLMEGHRHSNSWGFPPSMEEDPFMLESFFGPAFEPYSKMDETEQKQARSWYETKGSLINTMLGMTSWEEQERGSLIDLDLISFASNHSQLYNQVIDTIVERVYLNLDQDRRELVRNRFKTNPKSFAIELSNNVPIYNMKNME